jgi:monofunctional biosynthetic peptidoglycan transglycosylase
MISKQSFLRGLKWFALFILAYQLWIFLHICWWIQHNPSTSAFMKVRLEVMQEKNPDAVLKHKWVDYKNISPNLKRALIASEDSKFLDHEGFDWDGIQKAYKKNLK